MTPIVMRFAAAQAVLGGPRPGGIGPVRFGVGQLGGSREAPRRDWQHRLTVRMNEVRQWYASEQQPKAPVGRTSRAADR